MDDQNRCALCGGTLGRQMITHQKSWGGDLYEFENVPAMVCQQCDEVWLDAEVAQLMERIIEQPPQPTRFHQVPVFSLTEFGL